jgi:hypothetical protein
VVEAFRISFTNHWEVAIELDGAELVFVNSPLTLSHKGGEV